MKRKILEFRFGRDFAKDMGNIIDHPKILDSEPRRVIYFESMDVFHSIVTPSRLKLLQVLKQKPKLTINELAAEVHRPREAVSRDLHKLEFHSIVKLIKQGKSVRVNLDIDELAIPLTI